MKKSVRIAGILAGALAFTTLFGVSANADSRPQNESSWRESRRDSDRYDNDRRDNRDDRDFLRGRVERVDRRRNVVLLRASNGRTVTVQMVGRRQERRRFDVDDLRRGDYVTFVGDWSRGGFAAWRIDDVDRDRRGRW